MSKMTEQEQFWTGTFGAEYTERNTYDPDGLDALYLRKYGVTRTDLNREFLRPLGDISMLEAGCNCGNQLRILKQMGFHQLKGIELQAYAVEKCHQLSPELDVRQGSIFEMPYADQSFDLVFTSGVLIHISPSNLIQAMNEMYRVSKTYIWGFEYYAPDVTEINYRGNTDVLWKRDFAQTWSEQFADLTIEMVKIITDTDGLQHQMYLLKKEK